MNDHQAVPGVMAVDVSDPELYANDSWSNVFAEMRRAGPVHYCPDSEFGPYWSVVRFDEIMAVELDPETYSSEIGGIQIYDLLP